MNIKLLKLSTGETELVDSKAFFAALNPRNQNQKNIVEFGGALYSIVEISEDPEDDDVQSGMLTRTSTEGSGVVTIPTSGQVKMLFLHAIQSSSSTVYCEGHSNNVLQVCTGSHVNGGLGAAEGTVLNISTLGEGWTAVTTEFNSDNFKLSFTRTAPGIDLDVHWFVNLK